MTTMGMITTYPGHPDEYQLWNPAKDEVIRSAPNNFVGSISTDGWALSQTSSAWSIKNVLTGQTKEFSADQSQQWSRGSISPDNRLIALLESKDSASIPWSVPAGYIPNGSQPYTLVVEDIQTGNRIDSLTTQAWNGPISIQWSLDSKWLFFDTDEGHVTAFVPGQALKTERVIGVTHADDYVATSK